MSARLHTQRADIGSKYMELWVRSQVKNEKKFMTTVFPTSDHNQKWVARIITDYPCLGDHLYVPRCQVHTFSCFRAV